VNWQKRIDGEQSMTHFIFGDLPVKRVRYGDEEKWERFGLQPGDHCRDCGVVFGQVHVSPCCVEDCPNCGGQAISCECVRVTADNLFVPEAVLSKRRARSQ
jgi:hypothetical protein